MQLVLNTPVSSYRVVNVLGVSLEAGDTITCFLMELAGLDITRP